MAIPIAAAMIIATALSAAAQGASTAYSGAQSRRASERRAKELKRETAGGLYSDASQRQAELQAQKLKSNSQLGQRKAQGMVDTASLLREAFGI